MPIDPVSEEDGRTRMKNSRRRAVLWVICAILAVGAIWTDSVTRLKKLTGPAENALQTSKELSANQVGTPIPRLTAPACNSDACIEAQRAQRDYGQAATPTESTPAAAGENVPPADVSDSDDRFWKYISSSIYPSDYLTYLETFPNGKHRADAIARLEQNRPNAASDRGARPRAGNGVRAPLPSSGTPAGSRQP